MNKRRRYKAKARRARLRRWREGRGGHDARGWREIWRDWKARGLL